MPSPMTSMATSMERLQARLFKIEYCTVIRVNRFGEPGVQCHSPDHPEYYNTITIKVRNAKDGVDPLTLEKQYELVLQDFVGNCFGHPWTPRVGDLVMVLFLYNTTPVILGPVNTTYQAPPFRAPTCEDAMYDDVWKWCQWLKPSQDKNNDYYDHPKGRMPICKKLFHGPVDGKLGRGRDYQQIWDCYKGDCDPTCRFCEDIDSVPRPNEQWEKIYSSQTESSYSPPSRWEHHARCGSYLRFESETGFSEEYSEGRGHIRLGNAVTETDKRFHLNVQGSKDGIEKAGTFDLHTNHEEVSLSEESEGVRIACVRPDDTQVTWAAEIQNFPTSSYIRIMKDGKIILNSGTATATLTLDGDNGKITLSGTHNVEMSADTEIELTAPTFTVNAATRIDFNTPLIYMNNILIHGGE